MSASLLGLLLTAVAAASSLGPWGGLRDTAGTGEAGDVVLRLPVADSSWSLTDRTELQLRPFELPIWGPRVAVEHVVLDDSGWTVSLRPALGLSRGLLSTRGEVLAAWTGARHRLGGTLQTDVRLLRQTVLGTERTHEWSLQRVDVPLVLLWDWLPRGPDGDGMLRTRLRTLVHDEGEVFSYATLVESWTHRLGRRDRVFLEAGVAVLAGRPSEHVFLGRYETPLVLAYPRLDLWVRL